MKISYINYEDTIGRRFNGCDLARYFIDEKNYDCHMYVWSKQLDLPYIHSIFNIPYREKLYSKIMKIESKLGFSSQLYPFSLFYRKHIRSADLLHLNLIFQFYFNFFEFHLLSKLHPLVLSIHDMSYFTGRCVHSYEDCEQWKSGCRDCPSEFTSLFPIPAKRTNLLWKIKKNIYSNSNFNIVVASSWLKKRVMQSPMFKHCNIFKVPFGLDCNLFKPLNKSECKAKFGIKPDSKVIFFRALTSPFKGMEYIIEALESLETNHKICILTVGEVGVLSHLSEKFQIIETGVCKDEQLMVELFNAADIFLMPSLNETFGLMAMEAMACGVPSIVTEGTPLPEVTFYPQASLTVPKKDSYALGKMIKQLLDNPTKINDMAINARNLTIRNYSMSQYATSINNVYIETIEKFKSNKGNK